MNKSANFSADKSVKPNWRVPAVTFAVATNGSRGVQLKGPLGEFRIARKRLRR
jgi:hypothetical protein